MLSVVVFPYTMMTFWIKNFTFPSDLLPLIFQLPPCVVWHPSALSLGFPFVRMDLWLRPSTDTISDHWPTIDVAAGEPEVSRQVFGGVFLKEMTRIIMVCCRLEPCQCVLCPLLVSSHCWGHDTLITFIVQKYSFMPLWYVSECFIKTKCLKKWRNLGLNDHC